jgi:prepilin-type processing-associated H-X9-DG protein/prepilin-type N-terminal cleavage/methylation domain-containing protein
MRRQAAHRGNRAAGFTLTELLAVIALIALLIALLMPALGAARSKAMTTRCAANLHEIGHALNQYAIDYKGKVPRGYYYFPYYQYGYILWAEALSGYVGHPVTVADTSPARDPVMAGEFRQIGVYQCPVFPKDEQALDYVVNSWIAGGGDDGQSMLITKFRRVSELVYLTEANANRVPDQFAFHDVWAPEHLPVHDPGTTQRQMEVRVADDNRHRGRINALYFDGHVETLHFRDLKPRDFDPQWGVANDNKPPPGP